jgi:hypothetical protein
MRCTVKSSESRESEYSGLISTFCLFSSTTSHGKKAAGTGKERDGEGNEWGDGEGGMLGWGNEGRKG